MKYNRNKAYLNGIFIQQDGKSKGYCVTFPRIEEAEPIFPSKTFNTFQQALTFARDYKRCDRRVSRLPIWALQHSWRKTYCSTRLLTLVEAK